VAVTDLLRGGDHEVARGGVSLELEPYAYRWFRVLRRDDRRSP
jgi:hypothetical protein